MLRNLFKKNKKSDYDPLNIQVTDLKKGFIFEYDLKQWEIQGEYTYDWGENCFSKEFKISSGSENYFLSVDEDDELELVLYKKIKLGQIEENVEQAIITNEAPPAKLTYNGINFKRESEQPGYFLEEGSEKDWMELFSWQYFDASGDHALNIEQWGEREFEASYGFVIQEFEISNILPGEKP